MTEDRSTLEVLFDRIVSALLGLVTLAVVVFACLVIVYGQDEAVKKVDVFIEGVKNTINEATADQKGNGLFGKTKNQPTPVWIQVILYLFIALAIGFVLVTIWAYIDLRKDKEKTKNDIIKSGVDEKLAVMATLYEITGDKGFDPSFNNPKTNPDFNLFLNDLYNEHKKMARLAKEGDDTGLMYMDEFNLVRNYLDMKTLLLDWFDEDGLITDSTSKIGSSKEIIKFWDNNPGARKLLSDILERKDKLKGVAGKREDSLERILRNLSYRVLISDMIDKINSKLSRDIVELPANHFISFVESEFRKALDTDVDLTSKKSFEEIIDRMEEYFTGKTKGSLGRLLPPNLREELEEQMNGILDKEYFKMTGEEDDGFGADKYKMDRNMLTQVLTLQVDKAIEFFNQHKKEILDKKIKDALNKNAEANQEKSDDEEE